VVAVSFRSAGAGKRGRQIHFELRVLCAPAMAPFGERRRGRRQGAPARRKGYLALIGIFAAGVGCIFGIRINRMPFS
jgi:hypothetical protein